MDVCEHFPLSIYYLAKDGPVHCVKWSPKATEFVVVYGFMPSKAALYNLGCDVIFDFGEGPRNCAYFNPFGNHILFIKLNIFIMKIFALVFLTPLH